VGREWTRANSVRGPLNRRSIRRTLIVVAALVVMLAAGWWMRGQLLIDGCLDGGGSWDYDLAACDNP
jgi:hypothetical protein